MSKPKCDKITMYWCAGCEKPFVTYRAAADHALAYHPSNAIVQERYIYADEEA